MYQDDRFKEIVYTRRRFTAIDLYRKGNVLQIDIVPQSIAAAINFGEHVVIWIIEIEGSGITSLFTYPTIIDIISIVEVIISNGIAIAGHCCLIFLSTMKVAEKLICYKLCQAV